MSSVNVEFEARIQKANILVEALPYIRRFHGQYIVIKYGGSLMVDAEKRNLFANDIVLLKYIGLNPIIIHGGGKEISQWIKRVGKESNFIDGLRVTDAETMEITEMVLAGKISNEIVTLLNQSGGHAVGLSGKDSNMFTAKQIRSKDDQDLGQVGDVDVVDAGLIQTLSERGYIPVVASVGVSTNGLSLNLNADTVASAIAAKLQAEKLIYLTDVMGVLHSGKLVSQLDATSVRKLLSDPEVTGGMIPKLGNSLRAIENGVSAVHIINGAIEHAVLLEILTDGGIGTMITKEPCQNSSDI